MKARFFSAVLAAMLLATASVGVTASAAETTDEAASAVEETTETISETSEDGNAEDEADSTESEPAETEPAAAAVSEDMNTVGVDMEQFMKIMGQLAGNGTGTITITPDDNSSPDYYGDPYYDTDGNATLIKSEQIIYNTEEMQFIAVTTKDGHVFYVLINYTAANGEDNVYFLNKVDDYDLYALLYAGAEDDDEKNKITPEQAAQAAEEANGRVKPKSDTGDADTAETIESGEDTSEEVEQPKQNNMNMNSVYLVFGAIALIGVGAAGFFMMKKKNGGKPAVQAESDYDDETEIEEISDDDYPDYLDESKDDE